MSLFSAASSLSHQTLAHSSISDAWSVKPVTPGEYSSISLGPLTGSFVFLLSFLWSRISQLKLLVHQRDRQLKSKLAAASASINPAIPTVYLTSSIPQCPRLGLNREQTLRLALQREEFRVYYQPIVELQTSKIVGFEALVRWQHPVQGLLKPADFLPLAEKMGLIAAIDRWVLKTACQQLSTWQTNLDRQHFNIRPCLSINLSANYLSQPGLDAKGLNKLGLVDYVRSLLTHYSVVPQQITLEITESVMITDPQQAMETLRLLREMGLKVSLDDFGTGYSSLSYLHQFPVDVLKIDRAFVRHLGNQGNGNHDHHSDRGEALPDRHQVIVQAILDLAKGLNLCVVAEGVEQSCQHWQLKQMNCHYGQGDLFGHAVDAVSAQALLALKDC